VRRTGLVSRVRGGTATLSRGGPGRPPSLREVTITGGQPPHPLPAEQVPLAALADLTRQLGPRWDALARDPGAPSREVTTRDGWRTPAAIPMAQAIHHAECHRGHVLSVIGAHGIELSGLDIGEDLDIWHHGIAAGLMQETGPAQG
jgi:hypothetical protein